jgi:hypothetical protein
MTEGVVIGLETVEVEDRQQVAVLVVGLLDRDCELVHEQAAVAEARERIGERVAARGPKQPAVLGEGEQQAAEHEHERAGGERNRGGRKARYMVEDQEADGAERDQCRQDDRPRPQAPL